MTRAEALAVLRGEQDPVNEYEFDSQVADLLEADGALLAELAVVTGGRSFLLRDVKELDKTLAEVAKELRYQYLLGYAPTESIDPDHAEWRSIRVVAKTPGVKVRARDGYMTD